MVPVLAIISFLDNPTLKIIYFNSGYISGITLLEHVDIADDKLHLKPHVIDDIVFHEVKVVFDLMFLLILFKL